MLISIVIPTHNRHDYLKQCVFSIMDSISSGHICEIIVVDDGSCRAIDEQNKIFCSTCGINYLHVNKPEGAATARNYGIRKSSGEWIVFLDDDVVVEKEWFGKVSAIVRSLRNSSIVGVEGKVEPSGDGLWDREVQNLSGGKYLTSHMIYKKSMLERIGGFDESFKFPMAEDHELAVRAGNVGKLVFYPDLKVVHLPRNIDPFRILFKAPGRMIALLKSEYYFYSKHPGAYGKYRHSPTFKGTYNSILFKYAIISLKRRSFSQLLRRPLQIPVLLAQAVIGQITAWLLMPGILLSKKADG
ncbi:MAG: glycosyltransferase [Chitinivibrionales bacterium]|nr:glycosyltransferase [Chitinivibrionales bacterium]